MTYHSDLKEKIFLVIAMSWGLEVKKLSTPFFYTTKDGKQNSFWIEVQNHRDSELDIKMKKSNVDYAIIVIPNKRGDNLILFKYGELYDLPNYTFESLASKLIYKERIDITHEDKST